MKKIYIHIGFHKTGTSSIQRYLANNRVRLLEHKYLYPRTGCIDSAHHLLAISVNKNDSFISMINKDSHEYWNDLDTEIKTSKAENIILSSEEFSTIDSIDKIQHLSKYLAGKYEVKIIIYVRRIDSYCESIYKQLVKFYGSRFSEDFSLNANYVVNMFNPFDTIKKWEEIFGNNNIIVKVFEKRQMNNNLIKDFLISIKMEFNFIDMDKIENINSSLSVKNNEILKNINKLCNLNKEQHLFLVNFLENRSSKIKENELSYLSHKDRMFLIKKSSESDKKIAKHFLNRVDGRLYFDEVSSNAKWDKNNLNSNELLMLIVDLVVFIKNKEIS